jgi:hypothetical protein
MDVLGFLRVSLGSSTVRLHDSLGRRRAWACSGAGFSSEIGDRAKWVYYRGAAFCCSFFFVWEKGLSGKDMIKKCSMFTVESVCRVKRFTTGWQKFRCWRRGWNGGGEVAETADKRLLCCGSRRPGKAKGQVYECWWRTCREINVFFFTFECHMFYVLYPFVTIYCLSLPRICLISSHVLFIIIMYVFVALFSFDSQLPRPAFEWTPL